MISGLGKALQKKGNLVEIILPKYDCMQHNQINNLKVCIWFLNSYYGFSCIFCLFLRLLFSDCAGSRCCGAVLL